MSISFKCRSCGSVDGSLVLDLGIQPLANNLLRPEDLRGVEPKFPLRLSVCRSCWLLQILDLVPPVQLFSEYLYFSSFSEMMILHAREAVAKYSREFGLGFRSTVVEIASNDGYLLQNFQELRVPCYGIEPASNIAKVAREKGIETIEEFFGADVARGLARSGKQADLILGNNVFAHAPDTNDFVEGLRLLLKPGGRVVLEFPYAADFIEKTEFDTIYHEHVFYFSLSALVPLFERHGLNIFRVERIPIHGGSLRLFASHAGSHSQDPSVLSLLEHEHAMGIQSSPFYEGFGQRVLALKDALLTCITGLVESGKSLAAYGASAKGSTLLNFLGLDSKQIEFVADRSTYKQGRLTPGTHIPIVAPEYLAERMPDYTLLLTWNFAEEILRQQKDYRDRGGKFIIPIPAVTMA